MLIDFNIQGVLAFGASLPFDSQLQKSFSNWLPEKMKDVAQVRRQEFLAGRYCAFQASKMAGFELVTLPVAATREPVWPQGVMGSITHSKQLAISCVSISDDLCSVGIDAEELIKPILGKEIEHYIANEEELILLNKSEFQKGLTVLFSAKEALYKALFPIVRTFIDFKEVKLIAFDSENGSFELELNSQNIVLSKYLGKYKGSFKQIGETIITLVLVPKLKFEGCNVYS